MKILRSKWAWVVLPSVLIILIVWQLAQPNKPYTPTKQYPNDPVPMYPVVTDLAPDAVDLNNPKTFPSLTYGIHTFFWWDQTYRLFGLDQINIMQFSHIKQSFAWADIEPVRLPADDPTRYVWSQADAMMSDIESKGISVVARLDHPPDWAVRSNAGYNEPPFDVARFAEFCGALAQRYKGRIEAYQVWNEPNLTREWAGHVPSPKGYVKLLAACATAIRAADPDAIIISAGLSPTATRDVTAMPHMEYLWKMYEAGASPYFDVLGVHAPGWKFSPEAGPDVPVAENYYEWQRFRHVEDMRAIMVANGDAHKQIAITETGWTVDQREGSIYSHFGVTPEQQGDYLRRAYAYAAENWRPWLGLMTTIYYPNVAWTPDSEEYYWAIGTVAPMPYGMDGRPAWPALVQMEKISTNPVSAHPARDESLSPIESDD
ncbi:MAG: cellulase family glycosylhydrolase [Chloroflexi bacterium]|nr:cellulase family glycosylhydrolase [Chloroflexota bacterium]